MEKVDSTHFDTIIIGGGSAGAVLATRLSEEPGRSVLLLEAGSDFPHLGQLPSPLKHSYFLAQRTPRDSEFDWRYVARATGRGEQLPIPRGKVMGGSSAINAQIFLRGVPEDYDAWAALGNDRWSYEQVLPFFRRLESDHEFNDDVHGDDGPMPIARFPRHHWLRDQHAFFEACLAAGFPYSPDLNHPQATGIGPLPFNGIAGMRISTALAYLTEARHRPNLTIRPRSLVLRIRFRGRRAVGVDYAQDRGEIRTITGEEFILSAGVIGSPVVLLRSGIGPAARLRRVGISVTEPLEGVGAGLNDHPAAPIAWHTAPTAPLEIVATGCQLALRYTAPGSPFRNDLMILFASFSTERIRRGVYTGDRPGLGMIAHLCLAHSRGTVQLASDDPAVDPIIDLNYFEDPDDRARLRAAVRLGVTLAEHEALRTLIAGRIDPSDFDLRSDGALDEWLLHQCVTAHHLTSTCRMGLVSDPHAVVDQHGRVHGLDGLRVADASIMPHSVRANTNATAVMIGERIAALIRQGS